MKKSSSKDEDPPDEQMEVDEPTPPNSQRKSNPLPNIEIENTNANNAAANNSMNDDVDGISDDEEGGIRIGDIYIPPAPKPTLSMEATGPRMIITKIVNNNFKSYAGTQVLGPFHKSFTAIIGPNGSGKSNVIDSMLFVFGYRATKIRSKKISVLLHSSNAFPNVTSCTVAVHFIQIIDKEGENEYDVVPNSEVVVARTAFKDSSSFYTLNGKRVQFKEVSKMLKSQGIDLDHNRFLILQGEVEQIAMMKAKSQNENETGMLEYLEDIIGTSRFNEPIVKLNERTEELTEARKEKLNRVRLVEAEKQKLEGPMNEALSQLNIMNNLTRAKNTLLQKYIHNTNRKIEHTQEDKQKQETMLKEIDDKMAENKTVKDEKNKILAEKNKKYEAMDQRKDELTEMFRKMKTRDVTLQADSTQMTKRKKNIESVLEQEKRKLIDFQQIPDKNRKEIEDCENLSVKLAKQKDALEVEVEKAMSTLRSETQGLHEEKDKVQSRLIELRKTRDETKKNFALSESELKLYLSTQEKETEKLKNLKNTLEETLLGIQEKKVKLEELTKLIPTKDKLLANTKKTFNSLKEDEKEILAKIRTLRNQIEESKVTANANKYRGVIVTSLMGEKRSGNLPGIFGRLGDLGGIDLKYDVAISTCCHALDNIVVDTPYTGQKCIELLKAKDLGRATFIASEKQEHLRQYFYMNSSFPENAPRLFDLVRISDDRVKPVFYYALRDTLVANDMDQAVRISFQGKRYRVVTLGGEVIEVAGTMSGGGTRVIRGRIGTSVQVEEEVDPRILRAQEEELASLSERLKDIQSRLQNMGSEISSLTRECAELRLSKDRVDIEYKSFVDQAPTLKVKIKEQTEKVKNCSVDLKQKSAMERKTKDFELLFEKANLDAERVEKEVNVIHEKLVLAGGGKLKTLQKEVDDLDKKLDKIRSEVTKLNVAIKTSERNAKKSQEKIEQMEKEIVDLEEKLEQFKKEKKELTLEGAYVQKNLDEIQEQLSERNAEFSELKGEIAKIVAEENKMKGTRLEITNSLSKFDKTIDELKIKTRSWKREMESLLIEKVDIPGHEPPAPLAVHTPEELDNYKIEELQSIVNIQEERLGDQKPNLQAILDYKAKEELYLERANELEEITTKRNEARSLHDGLKKKRHNEFLAGFNTITGKLKEMYQMITLGGDAELELVDTLDPFTEGIVFSVRPPSKSWKTISNLSGGEKTLSSLALVFALHYYKPTPLYVMDEIDAALDFKNVSIVANYIKERTKNAQFIIISLRYNMFELANRLVGIYKTQDCTKSVTIPNDSALTVPTGNNDPNARVL